jgi:WD40 repeat protein
MWDLDSGQCLRSLQGHSDMVTAVAVAGRGRAVSASSDRTLRLWNLDSGRCLAVFPWHNPLAAVAVTPDPPYIVVAGDSQGNVLFLRIENLDRA